VWYGLTTVQAGKPMTVKVMGLAGLRPVGPCPVLRQGWKARHGRNLFAGLREPGPLRGTPLVRYFDEAATPHPPFFELPARIKPMLRYDPHEAPDPEEWLALDEQERIDLARDYHRSAGIRVPNATLHATLHAIVEAQIALGDKTPARRTAQRLMEGGLDRHEAIHAIAMVLVEHMGDLLKTTKPAKEPNAPYFAAHERLTAEDWRRL
jgi:hypothetical protein